jgi:signal transduction histidine kinase
MHLKGKVAGQLADGDLQLIDKIIDTINHLTSTTEQILDFARPVRLVPQWTDLHRVAGDVLQLLNSEISANGIEARVDLCGSDVMGMFDEASIRAALLNLGLNAVQAMPDGGVLTITTGADGASIWVVVSDSGSGVTQEQSKRMFEPFNTTKSRGLGLGMPYALKIVEQHGGAISVSSQPGQGTQVRIELPRNKGAKK